MRALLVFLMVISACSFSGSDGAGTADGPPDGDGTQIDVPPGACVPGFLDLCSEPAPTSALTVTGTMKINTDTDSRCRPWTQTGAPAICLLSFTRVDIRDGATLVVHGIRALALVATTEIHININGTLDVASRRTTPANEPGAGSLASCAFDRGPENDTGGGGGGAGGTYATRGGAGGDGDTGASTDADADAKGGIAGAPVAFSRLRGGCPGQTGASNTTRGTGGGGGGAVYLAARSIQITGAVLATGAAGTGGDDNSQGGGGNGGGGGGGGSGGTIVIQGSVAVTVDASGRLLATGGGGGGGADGDSPGRSGAEPTSITAAAGGDRADEGGAGGAGATTLAGVPGTSVIAGGGGGGGGGGYIRILSPSRSLTDAAIAPTPIASAQ